MTKRIPELYGSLVFNDKIMQEKLPKDIYKALRKTIENNTHLDLDVANSVAIAMKEWAVEHGATHFTHWFQPMTGFTAEKHDSFITPVGMEALNKEAVKVLHLLGKTDVTSVTTTVGPEQEYFLVDKELYKQRRDLIFTGRTLLGAMPPKGQEMEDHYFGTLKPRVSAYMHDLDEELWKLGIQAKTKHNEVAPAQHELAPIFDTTNVAVDHNQLTMELMKRVADKHGLVCLLHEKPFDGINGSGKHNNWSMSTNTGKNLLEPGRTPAENTQFLVFLMAVIKAVDEYADLMRLSVASAGNDHRLGANEAPPAIISIFLGDELTEVLDSIENDTFFGKHQKVQMDIGATVLPHFTKDNTDRNRTSPFAFTGNKFEFRMLGSSLSVSGPNVILNTAVAEAEKRGLYNLNSTPEVLPCFIEQKNIDLFTKQHILTEAEIHSRYEILLETYCKTLHIEAKTLADMVKKDFLPAMDEIRSYTDAAEEYIPDEVLPYPTYERLLFSV